MTTRSVSQFSLVQCITSEAVCWLVITTVAASHMLEQQEQQSPVSYHFHKAMKPQVLHQFQVVKHTNLRLDAQVVQVVTTVLTTSIRTAFSQVHGTTLRPYRQVDLLNLQAMPHTSGQHRLTITIPLMEPPSLKVNTKPMAALNGHAPGI